ADAATVSEELRAIERALSEPPPRWRWRALGAIAVGAALAAAFGPRLLRHASDAAPPATAAPATAAPASDKETAILILGIENRTSDPSLDATLDDAFASALGRSPLKLVVFQGHYLRALAEDLGVKAADESVGQKLVERDGGKVVNVRGAASSKGIG